MSRGDAVVCEGASMNGHGQQPLRVLMVVHSRQLGGAERHALALLLALRRRGCDVSLAAPAQGWLAQAAGAAGIRCHAVGLHGKFDALSAWRLSRLMRAQRPDVVHAHLTRSTHYADWGRRWSGLACALVATAHATHAHRHFERADRVIAVSAAVAGALRARGLAPERIDTVLHGMADPGEGPDGAAAPTAPGAPVRLGMLARFIPDKGHDTALRVLAEVRARTATPVQLHLAGDAQTPWGQQMKQLAHRLGVEDALVWHGQTDRPMEFLRSLDVVLVPSRREALGLTAVEALAVGRPVLASNLGGLPEVVTDGEVGRLLPVDDVSAWAQALLSLIDDPQRRLAWGRAARTRFKRQFDLERMVEQTLAVYRRAQRARGVDGRT
ncbi:MAG: glycosyltransferase family 4 protein [Pseudomonadota bacterium]